MTISKTFFPSEFLYHEFDNCFYNYSSKTQTMDNLIDQIRYILQFGVDSLGIDKQNITKEFLTQLTNNLQIENHSLKNRIKLTDEDLKQTRLQLIEEKQNNLRLEQYMRIIKQEMNNLKQMMDERAQQNEKKYLLLSQSSHSIIDELTEDLQRQREAANSLRHLENQLRLKNKIIKTSQASLVHLSSQNQSLRKLLPINTCLNQQVLQLEQKLKQSQQSQRLFQNQNQELQIKINQLEEENNVLQDLINSQIIKIKMLTNEYFGSPKSFREGAPESENIKNRQNRESNFQHCEKQDNAKYLRKVEQSFINEYLMQVKAFESHSIKNKRLTEEQTSQKNDMEFQFSLDHASQNICKTFNKQIEASSNHKRFQHGLFSIPKLFFQNPKSLSESKNKELVIEDLNSQKCFDSIVPLSIKNFRKQKLSSKPKRESSNSIENNEIHKSNLSQISDHLPTSTPELKAINLEKNKIEGLEGILQKQEKREKEIEDLKNRLKAVETRNKQVQKLIQSLQMAKADQIKMFQEQIYRQISQIQELNTYLAQQRVQKIEFSSRQQQYFRIIQHLQRLNQQFQSVNIQQQSCIQELNKAIALLSQRLMQVQEQKWQELQKNIPTSEHSTQTFSRSQLFGRHKIEFTCIEKSKKMEKDIKFSLFHSPHIQTQKESKVNQQSTNTIISQVNHGFSNKIVKVIDFIINISQFKKLRICDAFTNTQIQESNYFLLHKSIQVNQVDWKDIKLQDSSPFQQIQKLEQREQQKYKIQAENLLEMVENAFQQTMYYSFSQEDPLRLIDNFELKQVANHQNPILNNNEMQNISLSKNKNSFPERTYFQNMSIQTQIRPDSENEFQCIKKIKQILLLSSKALYRSVGTIPDISKLNLVDKKITLHQIINNFRDHQTKKKGTNFYLISCLLNINSHKVVDKLVIWRQGLVSQRLQKCLVMGNLKKYVYDPINFILGNCQITINLQEEGIQVKRKGKKSYFYGQMEDGCWKVVDVLGIGYF